MIYVCLADGFEELEALAPVDLLRRVSLPVQTVGVGGRVITGSHKVPVTCDITAEEMNFSDMTMLVLPGGMPGTVNLQGSTQVQAAIDCCVKEDKWLAAICAAPSILGKRGLLDGKTATCFPGFETQLTGATVTGGAVERDGKIITARGAGVAVEFALTLVECLLDAKTAQQLKEGLQCR